MSEKKICMYFSKVYYNEIYNDICIPESFDTNISHKLFDYIITFVNSQQSNTTSKDDFFTHKQV